MLFPVCLCVFRCAGWETESFGSRERSTRVLRTKEWVYSVEIYWRDGIWFLFARARLRLWVTTPARGIWYFVQIGYCGLWPDSNRLHTVSSPTNAHFTPENLIWAKLLRRFRIPTHSGAGCSESRATSPNISARPVWLATQNSGEFGQVWLQIWNLQTFRITCGAGGGWRGCFLVGNRLLWAKLEGPAHFDQAVTP